MVFEDIHWADEGLIAFVQYLLDWGRHHPIFVLSLARPEIADRHPGFPGSTRSATTLALEPLSDGAMDELLTGLVPGLPDEVRSRLREAADGIPLFAVETVRMLRDRGLLEQAGDTAVVTGDLTALEVPETLHALIASRLDGIPEAERKLLQDAAVLGKTFTRRGLSVLSGLDEATVDELLTSLVHKELLTIETDPFSPERGQLAFLQALVQRVTYETIARRDRRARHLAAASYLATDAGIDPDEIAEVIASHYLDAHAADPDAADRDDVRTEARRWFTRAAERAASLAASLEAQRAFERAADLAGEEPDRGRSLARAGELAVMGGRLDEAESLLRSAIEILVAAGERADAARAEVRLGEVFFLTSRIEEGVALLQSALGAHTAVDDECAIATVSAQLARLLFFEGRPEEAMPQAERALELGERLRLADVVVEALINKALLLQHRPNESLGLMRQALVLAEEAGVARGALRACMNLSYLLAIAGRTSESQEVVEHGLALARRRGDRTWEQSLSANLLSGYYAMGQWDDFERVFEEIPEEGRVATNPVQASSNLSLAQIALHRGEPERAVALAAEYAEWAADAANIQSRGIGIWARVLMAQAEGRHSDAVALCLEGHWGDAVAVEGLLELGGESAVTLSSEAALTELIARATAAPVDPTPPQIAAKLELQRARLSALRGQTDAPFDAAVAALREINEPFLIATAPLEQAEYLVAQGRTGEIEPPPRRGPRDLRAVARSTEASARGAPRSRLARPRRLACPDPQSVDRGYGVREALEREVPDVLDVEQMLDLGECAAADEHLAVARGIAEPRGEDRHRAERGVVEASLEADLPERGVSERDPDAEAELVAATLPTGCEVSHQLADREAHAHSSCRGVVAFDRVVEEDLQPVAGEEAHRRLEPLYEPPDPFVELAEHPQQLLGLDALCKRRVAPEVTEQHGDLPAVALQQPIVLGRDDDVRDLRRQEPA